MIPISGLFLYSICLEMSVYIKGLFKRSFSANIFHIYIQTKSFEMLLLCFRTSEMLFRRLNEVRLRFTFKAQREIKRSQMVCKTIPAHVICMAKKIGVTKKPSCYLGWFWQSVSSSSIRWLRPLHQTLRLRVPNTGSWEPDPLCPMSHRRSLTKQSLQLEVCQRNPNELKHFLRTKINT